MHYSTDIHFHHKPDRIQTSLTSYLDTVPMGGVHDCRHQVLGGLAVVVAHAGWVPGQHHHPWRGMQGSTASVNVKYKFHVFI